MQVGETVRFGHYEQEQLTLPDGMRVLDFVKEAVVEASNGECSPAENEREAQTLLRKFLFSQVDGHPMYARPVELSLVVEQRLAEFNASTQQRPLEGSHSWEHMRCFLPQFARIRLPRRPAGLNPFRISPAASVAASNCSSCLPKNPIFSCWTSLQMILTSRCHAAIRRVARQIRRHAT